LLLAQAKQTQTGTAINSLENEFSKTYSDKRAAVQRLVRGIHENNGATIGDAKKLYFSSKLKEDSIKRKTKDAIAVAIPGAKTQDRDYIFLNFVLHYLPHGVIGLLLAVMFSAAMSSMSSELSALASTTTVDVYKRMVKADATSADYLASSKWFTIMWALLAMGFAMLASFAENLIQFVNIVGSLFYGTILGIFLVAFYVNWVKSNAVFWAAIIAEAVVLACYFCFYEEIAFLYYNIIGCGVVVLLAVVFQAFSHEKTHLM